MEDLLGLLFVLYVLGSILSGLLRRGGRSPQRRAGKGAGRPGLPSVLDMEELERRLRELSTGRPEPEATGTPPRPEPVRAPEIPRSAAAPRPTVAPEPAFRKFGADDGDGWAESGEEAWSTADEPIGAPTRGRRTSLPPVVASYLQRDNPWQGAFVVKELLGPPRALSPHRGRPPF